MKTINCHECDAQNPAQSKFCNNCGASLESDTTHICPACQTPNPIDLLYCDNCGTRLVEDPIIDDSAGDESPEPEGSRSEPFSLPSRPPGETGNLEVSGEIPEWLKTGESTSEEEEQAQEEPEWLQAAQEDESWQDQDAPTLDEVSGDHAPQDDLPAWLLDDDTREEIFRGDRNTDELFMASLSGDEDEEPRQTGSLLEGDIPEWLRGLSDAGEEGLPEMSGEVASGVEDRNDTLPEEEDEPQEDEREEEKQTQPGGDASAELQGWLTDLESVESEEEELLRETGSVHDEPSPEETGAAPAPAPGSETEGTEEEDAAQLAPAQETEETEDDVPAWLQEMDADLEDVTGDQTEQDSPTPPPGDEGPESSSDEPQEAQADREVLTEVEDEKSQEDFLEWLETLDDSSEQGGEEHVDAGLALAEDPRESPPHDEAQPDEPQQEIAQEDDDADTTDDDSELPEWLAGVTSELDESALEPDPVDAGGGDAPRQPLEQPQPPADEEESEKSKTAWGDELPFEAPHDFITTGSESDVADAVVNAEDLPDWFSDVMADIEMAEQEQAGDKVQEIEGPPEMANVPQQIAGGELPKWLDSPFEEDDSDAEPTPIDEIPEWLRSPLQANLAKTSEESRRPVDDAQSDEDWADLLDELPPPDEEVGELSEATVPDWLEALKPEALGGEAMSTAAPPKETNGPLAGLSNVISVAPAIAQLRPTERIEQPATGAGREQQTELLRQLTRSAGPGTVKVGARAPVASPVSRGVRLLLAILLLSAVIVGLLYPTLLENIGPLQTAVMPAAQDALSAAAGRPVIVAFEYTPAMAGALDPEADALLQSFVNNDSTVIAVSQSAPGVAMAQQSLQRAGAEQGEIMGYIPGGPVGLRRLRHCLNAGGDCQTLYGRPLDNGLRDALSDTSLIVVLAGDGNELLDWIEQVGTSTEIPLLAAVTPAVAPVAAPYHSSGQLTGVFSNIAQTENAPESSTLSGTPTALTLTQWLAAAAMFFGSLYYLVVGPARSNEASRYE